ncbi:MEKHLA domain-containing protein [Mariprofundus erugo]|uniref:MEKHLA domain-containing protein n=1 Tax=Mariprofundus erugo TaxID=2528639 RepID=UPI0010FED0E4|nr:MEKHLA domain-containing protein [Mariprofundus erugo]TLS76885.1 MEKHLA domain-containing protein [Mariprofundus erugo]
MSPVFNRPVLASDDAVAGKPPEPDDSSGFLWQHVRLISDSLCHWRGEGLNSAGLDDVAFARAVYEAPFALLSHGTGADPLFNYANRAAQQRFAMGWSQIIGLPSRYSAEPLARAERDALLQRVSAHGYIDDYSGIRIAAGGQRFRIEQALVWNLLDRHGRDCGQAAMFSHWRDLD